jgi:hypothetical protein
VPVPGIQPGGDAVTGYNPALARLAKLSLPELTGLYGLTFPNRALPVDRRGGFSRDLLIAPLLPPPRTLKRRRVTRPYPREATR